jgi:predicted small lipoprotein YifL
MTTAITPIRIVVAVAALLALSAIGARAALAYPSADGADTQLRTNVLGSQLDRVQPDGYQPQLHDGYQSTAGDIYPDAFERAAIRLAGSDYPDVIERAVLARQAEVAAQQANIVQSKPDGYQPQLHTQQPVSGGSDGSFDWNLFAMVLALGLAACGIAVLGIRHRERVAHP